MEKTRPSSVLDDRLDQVDPQKLANAAGDASLDSPPFYNCFFNTYSKPVVDTAREERATDTR